MTHTATDQSYKPWWFITRFLITHIASQNYATSKSMDSTYLKLQRCLFDLFWTWLHHCLIYMPWICFTSFHLACICGHCVCRTRSFSSPTVGFVVSEPTARNQQKDDLRTWSTKQEAKSSKNNSELWAEECFTFVEAVLKACLWLMLGSLSLILLISSLITFWTTLKISLVEHVLKFVYNINYFC
jgi:hypothetical protein